MEVARRDRGGEGTAPEKPASACAPTRPQGLRHTLAPRKRRPSTRIRSGRTNCTAGRPIVIFHRLQGTIQILSDTPLTIARNSTILIPEGLAVKLLATGLPLTRR